MATIYDVAKRAGVSTYTVSSVINKTAFVSPELTARVMQAVTELDYTINDLARSLQTRKTRTVGMLIPDIGNPFYAKVVRGVEDVLKEAGYSLILGNTYNSAEEQSRYLAVFRSKQVDGLLLFVSPAHPDAAPVPIDSKRPTVFVGRVPNGVAADVVSADNTLGTQLAIEHLISRGHRRIGLITGHLDLSTGRDRVVGWKKALRKAKLPASSAYIGEGDWTAVSAVAWTRKFLALDEPPTAIFAANFLMMTGVLRALQDAPPAKPVQVMSSDDSEWLDVFQPRVSTVAQPSYTMGSNAAALLLKRFKDPGREVETIILKPALTLRD